MNGIGVCLLVLLTMGNQDTNRVDEILRFFPDGLYAFLSHSDQSTLADEEAWPTFKWFIERNEELTGGMGRMRIPLPEYIADRLVSRTSAQILDLAPAPAGDLSGRRPGARRGDTAPEGGGNTAREAAIVRRPGGPVGNPRGGRGAMRAAYRNEGAELHVFRFDDTALLVREALGKKDFAPAGQRIDGQPAYRFAVERRRDGSSPYFCVATVTGELLVSDDIALLVEMAAAGEGENPGILSVREHLDALLMIPELGHTWTIHFTSIIAEQQLRMMEDQDADEEARERLNAFFARRPLFSLVSNELGENISTRTIEVYANEEAAADGMAFRQQFTGASARLMSSSSRVPAEFREYAVLRQKRTTVIQDGPRIITTVLFDKEFMKAQLEMTKAFVDRNAAAQEERARLEAEKKKQ